MKKILYFVLFLWGDMCVFPQGAYFEHLGVTNGLSHYSVNSIYQDEHGFIWIGTRDGLNLYDGNDIRIYRQQPHSASGLFGNNIRLVCGDKKGYLFMLCKSGAVLFDLKTEVFTTVRRNNVSTLASGIDGFWMAVGDSLISYYPADNKINLQIKLAPSVSATVLFETKDRLLYVATDDNKLLVFDQNRRLVKSYNIENIISLYEDSKKNIWACTRYKGLFKIDYTGNVVQFQHDSNNSNSLPDNFVRTVCEDDLGNYWVGMFSGLCKLNLEKGVSSSYKYEREQIHGLSNWSVWCIMKDVQGTLWIGTYYGAINLINPRFSIFNYYDAQGVSSNSSDLSSSVVSRIVEEDNDNVWVATDGGGINLFDRRTQLFQTFRNKKGNSDVNISANTVKSLWLDKKRGNLWIGTHMGGLNKLNLKTKQFTSFLHNPDNQRSIPNNNVRELVYRNDTLYLATQNSIGVFDLRTETCALFQFKKDMKITGREIIDLLLDSKNRMWFAFSSNIVCVDMRTGKIKEYRSTNNATVFFEDSKKRILVGTDGGGIMLYDEVNQQFEPYDKFNNLMTSKYVIDLKESNGGYFYVATNDGLLVIDTEHNNSILLNTKDGFPLDALNERSVYINANNEVFVGGINGIVIFQEKDLNRPRIDYTINITDLWVNNKRVVVNPKSILKQSLPYLDEIVLKPEHSVFTIFFGTTNYLKVLKTDVQYQLVGFDNDWIDANYRQSITYTNLNAGHYVLKIKGKTPVVNGTYPERIIKITVLPPLYKTAWAYLIYAIVIASIVLMFIRFYSSRIQLRASLEYEKREKEHIEETNQSKLQFFTNISHEFRTPLTLIISQLEIILQMANVPQSIYSKLLSVVRNTNRMKKLIAELLDFRKHEQGSIQLKVSEQDFIPFLNEIYLAFKELAQSKNITYSFVYKEPEVKLWYDTDQLEKVFYNLLVNAFKYTANNGSITLRTELIGYYITVYVEDNGIGIPKELLNRIFDCYYQIDNGIVNGSDGQGSGIGLALTKRIVELHHGEIGVESRLNGGSCFWVRFKLGDAHFSKEQKVASKDRDATCISETVLPDKDFIEEIIESQKEVNSDHSTILIVEDNEEVLHVLVTIFEPLYKVVTAINGADGLEKAIKYQPDIVLSDVMMPCMSGIEMCGKIKSNFETSHIPVILLTAKTAMDFMVQGLLTGADDYIIKPFNTKVLVTRCNNLVNSRKVLQKKFVMQSKADPQLIATNVLDQQLLERAIKIVEKHIDNPEFDINIFASEMYLSRTNLFNKLKGITGQTPNDFVANLRLNRSIFFLTNSLELSITDISDKMGFGSTSYFIRCFRKKYGITPSQYRKNSLK